jgi:hypothetical protein
VNTVNARLVLTVLIYNDGVNNHEHGHFYDNSQNTRECGDKNEYGNVFQV